MRLTVILLSLISITNALNLIIKSDYSQLQKNLGPDGIGSFLHSIEELTSFVEYLDPARSHVQFDLLYYYNEYGCCNEKFFNMNRIGFIMSYANLCREDKLLLLNVDCIYNWLCSCNTSLHDVTFLLDKFPESNPLLKLTSYKNIEQTHVVGDWHNFKLSFPAKFSLLLDNALKHRHNLNFVSCIEVLFRFQILKPSDITTKHIKLVNAIAVDAYIQVRKDTKKRLKQCTGMILSPELRYNTFSSLEMFNMGLNIITLYKYKPSTSFFLKLQRKLKELIEIAQIHQEKIVSFLTKLEAFLIKLFALSVFDGSVIFEILKDLCELSKNQDEEGSGGDSMFMAIEFYSWIRDNLNYLGIEDKKIEKCLKQIYEVLSIIKNQKYREYFLQFLLFSSPSSESDTFKMFISNNYDSNWTSIELLKIYKNLSWFNVKEKTEFLKDFLKPEIRLNQLRKYSFRHKSYLSNPNRMIETYFDENSSISANLFNGVFNSLIDNELLVYPLEVQFSENISLEAIFKKVWIILGEYDNGFFRMPLEDDYKDSEMNIVEYVPLPWTHPNVLLAVGTLMTLALLHGIKLTGWSLKRELFDAVFKEIEMIPLVHDEDELYFEENHFINFYHTSDYSKSIMKHLNDPVTSDSTKLLLKQYETLSNFTKKSLKNYQKKIFNSNTLDDFDFRHALSEDVKVARLFLSIEEISAEDSMEVEENFQLNLLKRTKCDNYRMIFSNSYLWDSNDVDDSSNSNSTSLNYFDPEYMIKLQMVSLHLGLQPIIRYLKAEEAFNLIFIE